MSRRQFVSASAAGALRLAAGSALGDGAGETMKRPNIVYVFPDEFRRPAMGFWGEDPVHTPNFDRFASQSRVLTRAISNYPVCSPYRAMLMTGKYPPASGAITNCNSSEIAETCYLRTDARCLPDVLSDAGYSLGYIGKWHLEKPHEPYVEAPRGGANGSVWDEYTPRERRHGFDFWHSYGCYDQHLHPHYWIDDAPRDKPVHLDEWSVAHESDVAVDYIRNRNGERRAEQPFALFVAMNPPHMPFNAVPQEYLDIYADADPRELLTRPNVDHTQETGGTETARRSVQGYFSAVTGIDENFGRILRALEEAGLEDDTIVVVTSDHGEMMGSHGRMYKDVWYEESAVVPFLMRWPGRVSPGRDDLMLSVPDLYPTLLGLCDLGEAAPADLHGVDLSGSLLGQGGPRPESAPYLTIRNSGVFTERYTYAREGNGNTWLFDNHEDPYQLRSISVDQPALALEMEALSMEWRDRIGAPKEGLAEA